MVQLSCFKYQQTGRCKDYTVSKEFAKDFFEVEKWKKISNWKLDMENAREQKVQMCYCSWDDKCNEVGKTIGVSKSGVATLALTTVLLIGAITGSYLKMGFSNLLDSGSVP